MNIHGAKAGEMHRGLHRLCQPLFFFVAEDAGVVCKAGHWEQFSVLLCG